MEKHWLLQTKNNGLGSFWVTIMSYIKRRHEGHMLRRMLDAPVPGQGQIGRQKTMWKDWCKSDMESVELKEEDVLDRAKWENDIRSHAGAPRWWEKPEEKMKKGRRLCL